MSRYHVRRKMKKDGNHREIVAYFRQCGAIVDDVSDLAGLGYDIILSAYGVGPVLVEIKDGSKPPSERRLTESEEAAQARWGAKFAVVSSIEEARGLLDNMERYGNLEATR